MDRRARNLSFGAAAEDYERYRFGYPDALAERVETYAGRPLRTALEVGAGTGKATPLFAGRGVAVTAVEPDPQMAAVLTRETTGLPVGFVVGTFEDQPVGAGRERFDLLFAAASWHWTDPATRWERAAACLGPGGVLAVFGSTSDLADPELDARVEAIHDEVFVEVDRHDPIGRWSVDDLAAADGFVDVVEERLARTVTVDAEAWVGRLTTVSAYLMLGEAERAEALTRVRALLPDRVELDATITLLLGRGAGPTGGP